MYMRRESVVDVSGVMRTECLRFAMISGIVSTRRLKGGAAWKDLYLVDLRRWVSISKGDRNWAW